MANGKKRRKQKKRSKIKMDSALPASNNQVKIKTVNGSFDNNFAPAILAPAYKKINRIAKFKGSAFVPPSCITSYCSTPYQAINKPKPEFRFYHPPLIKTTHIFDSGPTKKIRRRKLGNCTVIVPPNCLQSNQVKQSVKLFNDTYPKPIILGKAADIIMPVRYYRRKKRWVTGAPIVPLTCITISNSVVKTFKSQQQKKFYYPPPLEHKLSPPIIGPERFKRRHKKYNDKNVIVPGGCIIQPKAVIQTNSYDWRKAFPKPITLEKVADIVGPTIKIRTKKRHNNDNSFVPASCIIVQKEVPPPDLQRADEEHAEAEAEAVALAQEAPTTTDSESNLYLLAVAVIVAVIIFAFVFNR